MLENCAQAHATAALFLTPLLSIVRKYGIAGAIAAGIITQQQAEEMTKAGAI